MECPAQPDGPVVTERVIDQLVERVEIERRARRDRLAPPAHHVTSVIGGIRRGQPPRTHHLVDHCATITDVPDSYTTERIEHRLTLDSSRQRLGLPPVVQRLGINAVFLGGTSPMRGDLRGTRRVLPHCRERLVDLGSALREDRSCRQPRPHSHRLD
ncbi:MAG: hypothetical protein JJE52_15620 [Acidimicrobiia bacterium]|nr:hypothetical protein [Acidimicrobiia bacterium]